MPQNRLGNILLGKKQDEHQIMHQIISYKYSFKLNNNEWVAVEWMAGRLKTEWQSDNKLVGRWNNHDKID